MIEGTFSREAFLGELRSLGYELTDSREVGSGVEWLRWSGSKSGATHVLQLHFGKTWNAYSMRAGVVNEGAVNIVRSALPRIGKFLHPALLSPKNEALYNAPCLASFDVGRGLDWKMLRLPQFGSRATWIEELRGETAGFLKANFWSVDDISGIEALLLREETPFEWMPTNAVLRVAELLALTRLGGGDLSRLEGCLGAHDEQIRRETGKGLPEVFASLRLAIDSQLQ